MTTGTSSTTGASDIRKANLEALLSRWEASNSGGRILRDAQIEEI